MMKMEVELVSRETIKPSFPTPNHLKNTFNLSFFDQISYPLYIPVILFYEEEDKIEYNLSCHHHRCRCRLDLIKKSLAETLTRFYPFAGRFEDNMFVDCNDEGVEYVEARVSNCRLSQLVQHHNLNELAKQLYPWDPIPDAVLVPVVDNSSRSIGPISTKVLLAIQVTIFEECGGIVISGFFSHKIADASSMFNFINDWAATTRAASSSSTNDAAAHLTIKAEEQQQGRPNFKLLHCLFPPKHELRKCFVNKVSGGHIIQKVKGHESLVVKKFVLGTSKIADLKKKSTTTTTTTNVINNSTSDNNDNDIVLPPTTRVQAVSALLWKCLIDVDIAKSKKKQERAALDDIVTSKVYALQHTMNLRARMVPPLPTNSIGNLIGKTKTTVVELISTTKSTNNTDGADEMINYPNLVRKVKESLNKFNASEYVREIQNGDLPSDEYFTREVLDAGGFGSNQMVTFYINSWCGLKKYERADFGWGKPKWVGCTPLPYKNSIRLMDTSSGDGGIEAWVILSKEDMAEFERHPQLIAFTTY